ncbi:MAG: choice-of-anchor B family protein [Bacteroidota bacterium]
MKQLITIWAVACFSFFLTNGFSQENIVLRSNTPLPSTGTDVWGYVDPESGTEFALIGTFQNNVYIYDLSDPDNPQLAATTSVPGFDIKTFGKYMYTVTGSNNGDGSIVDIEDPYNPVNVGNFPSAHNIWIDEANGYLYAECTGLKIYDLNIDPTQPVEVFDNGVLSCHDAVVLGNRLFNFAGGSGTYIYDITDPTQPAFLGGIVDPTIQYHHSGWTTEDGDYLYICDELIDDPGADITIWDIRDLDNPIRVGELKSPTAIVHNIYVIGDVAFVSYYADGLKLFDVSDPVNPVLIDEFDTAPDLSEEVFGGAFGVYPFLPSGLVLVSDMQAGLFVFDLEASTSVAEIPQLGSIDAKPNPFSDYLEIDLLLDLSAEVQVALVDLLGRTVALHEIGLVAQGETTVRFETGSLPAGTYFYQAIVDGAVASGKVMLVR